MIRRPPRSTQSRSSAASDVYKRQGYSDEGWIELATRSEAAGADMLELNVSCLQMACEGAGHKVGQSNDLLERYTRVVKDLSLIHISEPTRLGMISYAVFCLKK